MQNRHQFTRYDSLANSHSGAGDGDMELVPMLQKHKKVKSAGEGEGEGQGEESIILTFEPSSSLPAAPPTPTPTTSTPTISTFSSYYASFLSLRRNAVETWSRLETKDKIKLGCVPLVLVTLITLAIVFHLHEHLQDLFAWTQTHQRLGALLFFAVSLIGTVFIAPTSWYVCNRDTTTTTERNMR